MRSNTDRMLQMVDAAVEGSAPFLPVRLVVFPEFAHAAPVFQTVEELLAKLTVPIPNEHTERLIAKAREYDLYIQSGTMLEEDPKWPGVVFNTTCLVGPNGMLYRYRKVNPWIPYEVHSSPHDLPGYDEPLFPVADTPIGKIGCAICYDWLFPEAIRQLAMNGAEVLVRVSAYMDPWGATEPMNWWTTINRARARHRLCRRREPGGESAALSAVLLAGRIPDRRLRRPPAGRCVSRTWRTDCRRADRHLERAARARVAARASHAGAPEDRGVSGLRAAAVPAGGVRHDVRRERAADRRWEETSTLRLQLSALCAYRECGLTADG
jgi:predicted amidohydrolase